MGPRRAWEKTGCVEWCPVGTTVPDGELVEEGQDTMRRTLTLVSVLTLMVSMLALPALATDYDPPLGEEHTGSGGNCDESIQIDGETYDGVKLDDGPRGDFDLGEGVSIFVEENSVTASGGTVILCVKGGPGNSGTVVIEDGDTFHYPEFGISNIVVYLVIPTHPEALINVVKTAEAVYYREVTWELEKTVDGEESLSFSGRPGDTFPVTWEVLATKNDTGPFGFMVSGDITISYSASNLEAPIAFNVADVLDDGTVANVDCESYEIDNGAGVINCTYEANPDDDTATLNTATVELLHVPEDFELLVGSNLVATAAVEFEEMLTGSDEANLTDPRFSYNEIIDTTTYEEFQETFACDAADSEKYVDRTYTETFVNDAFLTADDGTNLDASASVTVTCTIPYQGLTPGFWKQPQHFEFWVGYGPGDLVGDVFFVDGSGVDGDATLLEALDWSSGNTLIAAKEKLVRQAVAALLNAAHPDVDYPLTEAEIISTVNSLLQSDSRNAVNAYANLLDEYNNLGNVDLKG
jgi:hypothetical protein